MPDADRVAPVVTDAISVDVQNLLNTPSATPSAAAGVVAARSASVACAFGNSDCSRSFQVISGTTASTRWSVPASMRDSAPP
jgi:hypothetical protein